MYSEDAFFFMVRLKYKNRTSVNSSKDGESISLRNWIIRTGPYPLTKSSNVCLYTTFFFFSSCFFSACRNANMLVSFYDSCRKFHTLELALVNSVPPPPPPAPRNPHRPSTNFEQMSISCTSLINNHWRPLKRDRAYLCARKLERFRS